MTIRRIVSAFYPPEGVPRLVYLRYRVRLAIRRPLFRAGLLDRLV